MKKLLLIALMFAGAAVFAAKPSLVVDFYDKDATIADKGDAWRVKDLATKGGDKKGVSVYFPVRESEWQTAKATISASDCQVKLRAAKGGSYECKSLKVNGKELLSEPVLVGKGQKAERYEATAANGKMEVVVEARLK